MAFLMLICAVPVAGVARYAYKNRKKPGARGFLLCLVGMVGWSIMLALITWPTRILPVYLNTTLRNAFQMLVIFGWPLLVWEYTRRDKVQLRRAYVALLLVVPVLTILLTATNPWHHLVIAAETPANPTGISEFVLAPWYLVHIGFAVALVMLPVGVLLYDLRSAHGAHRRQLVLLLAGWVVGFPGALQTHLFRTIESIPLYVDLTPVAFILTTALWGVALFRYHLFGMVPVSRRTAVDTMDDPVISVDTERTVVDTNPAAQRLFNVDGDAVGTDLTEFCRDHPDILSLYESGVERSVEVTLETDTQIRHFSLHLRPIEQGSSVTGSLIVLREITRLRERERELDLLKQVFSRVLRHNVRNELTVLKGHVDGIEELDEDGRFDEQTSGIADSTEHLIAHAEKAISLRKVIDAETTPQTVSIGSVVRAQVESYREQFPGVEIETRLSDDVEVTCHPDIEKAVQEVLQNSILHHPGDRGEIRLRVSDRRRETTGVLVIEDNGPGIDPQEIKTLEAQGESDLQHGSGVGLWMVNLILQKSGGTLGIDVESDLGGTRVELALPLADRTTGDVPSEGTPVEG